MVETAVNRNGEYQSHDSSSLCASARILTATRKAARRLTHCGCSDGVRTHAATPAAEAVEQAGAPTPVLE